MLDIRYRSLRNQIFSSDSRFEYSRALRRKRLGSLRRSASGEAVLKIADLLLSLSIRLFLVFTFLTLFLFVLERGVFAASFSLNPEIVSTQAGQEFSVDVLINTQKTSVDGADVVLTYNSEKLEVVKIEGGEAFGDYPIQKAESGLVKITGIAASQGPFFSGEARFASVRFKALSGGEEGIRIDFADDSTVESNIAAHGSAVDILSEASDSLLYISGGSTASKSDKKQVAGRILLIFFYLVITAAVAFFAYRWWVSRSKADELFVPESVPLDRPPPG